MESSMTAKVITVAPIIQRVVVNVPREKAFDLFTSKMTDWWFVGRGIGPNPFKEIVIEPRRGGRWFERAEDGAETNWGEVLQWDRPSRILLAWRIDASWKFDPELETLLEIKFDAVDPNSTQILLEHRNLDRLGESARETIEGMDSGWASLLKRFADLAARVGGTET
jgi:uncharacterized protein YndB with AHSA1/START domain